jgi:homoserine dehydrogenase
MSRELKIGLFGFGVVGEGIYHVLQATPSLNATIKKVCIKQKDKKRNAPEELFTVNASELLEDPEINVIVELIDDAKEAFIISSRAIKNKKALVSANKKMIAENLQELLDLQDLYQTPLLYEASVCGSIPVIRNLEEYYDNDLLQGICGIVNGSTNFILSRMFDDSLSYSEALQLAQQAGFAESDPGLDVRGIDAVNKLTILLLHGYGIVSKPEDHLHIGIDRIHNLDAKYAAEKNVRIRLVAQSKKLKNGRVAAFVLPQFVSNKIQLYNVNDEYNGIVLQSSFADKQFLYGKGAGRYPTSSAVLSDISALRYDYRYEYRKLKNNSENELTDDFYLELYAAFPIRSKVDKNDFEWITEYNCRDQRQYIKGVIHYRKLLETKWVNDASVSLVLCPEGIIENEEVAFREVKEKFWKLAGVAEKKKEVVPDIVLVER